MEKLKAILFSENGMRIINVLFLLSCIIRRSGFLIVVYGLWIVYLIFCIKNSETKFLKIIYAVLIGIAAIVILLNIRYLFRY